MLLSDGWAERPQRGDAGQRDESHPGWEGVRVHLTTQNGARLKTYELFVSRIFIYYFRTAFTVGS